MKYLKDSFDKYCELAEYNAKDFICFVLFFWCASLIALFPILVATDSVVIYVSTVIISTIMLPAFWLKLVSAIENARKRAKKGTTRVGE